MGYMDIELTKYDVMMLDEKNEGRELLKITFDLRSLVEKMKNDSFSLGYDGEACKLLKRGFKHMVNLSHYAYENAKDLHGLDNRMVTNFLVMNRLGVKKFPDDYCSNLLEHTKILLIDMILKDEDIDISWVDDISILQKITGGEGSGILDVLGESSSCMKPENYRIVKTLSEESFSISDLDTDDINRLNNYHDDFVNENILAHVTLNKKEDYRVLNLAKKIGYKGKGSL